MDGEFDSDVIEGVDPYIRIGKLEDELQDLRHLLCGREKELAMARRDVEHLRAEIERLNKAGQGVLGLPRKLRAHGNYGGRALELIIEM